MSTLISITITDQDVAEIADASDVDPFLASERAAEWAKYIEETATALVNEQLASVIETGQP